MICYFSASWTSTLVIELLGSFVPALARFLCSALVLSRLVMLHVNCRLCHLWTLGTLACELICVWTGGSNDVSQWWRVNLWTCGSPVFENFGCMNIKSVMYEPTFVLDVWTCVVWKYILFLCCAWLLLTVVIIHHKPSILCIEMVTNRNLGVITDNFHEFWWIIIFSREIPERMKRGLNCEKGHET
jgi:hypothetical protein